MVVTGPDSGSILSILMLNHKHSAHNNLEEKMKSFSLDCRRQML